MKIGNKAGPDRDKERREIRFALITKAHTVRPSPGRARDLVVPDQLKGRDTEALIRRQYRDANARFEAIDLANLDSVMDFTIRLLTTGHPIDILVNNAGVMTPCKRKTTDDGFEMQFGTNYLSHRYSKTLRSLP